MEETDWGGNWVLFWLAGPCSGNLYSNFLLMGRAVFPPCYLTWGSVLLNSLHSVLSLKTSPQILVNLKETDMAYVLIIFQCITNQPPNYFIFFNILSFFVWYYFAQFEKCWRSWLSSAGQFSLEVSHAVLVCGVRVSSKLFFTHGLSGGGWLSTRMSVELLLENRAWTNGLSKLPGVLHSLVAESQRKEYYTSC